MMAGFRQFFMIFFMESINIGPVYIRGGVSGGKSLNKEEIQHKAMMCTYSYKGPIFHYKA